MRRHFKSHFPAANVSRLNETVATDTFFSEVESLDDGIPGHGGCTMVQLYAGVTSHLLAAYPMSHESKMPQSLMDFIKEHGLLFRDNAKVIFSQLTKDILRMYCIGLQTSESLLSLRSRM